LGLVSFLNNLLGSSVATMESPERNSKHCVLDGKETGNFKVARSLYVRSHILILKHFQEYTNPSRMIWRTSTAAMHPNSVRSTLPVRQASANQP
jgi:hypothetical protein